MPRLSDVPGPPQPQHVKELLRARQSQNRRRARFRHERSNRDCKYLRGRHALPEQSREYSNQTLLSFPLSIVTLMLLVALVALVLLVWLPTAPPYGVNNCQCPSVTTSTAPLIT